MPRLAGSGKRCIMPPFSASVRSGSAPQIEKRLRQFRRPHCGSIRVDETYVKIRGKWRYLYRAVDKHGVPVDFLLTAKRDLDAAKRFFRKALKGQPLLAPKKIGTDGASVYPTAISDSVKAGLMPSNPTHRVSKHLQQGIESDHFHVKKNMPKIGGFRSLPTARRTIAGFEAMLWLKKGLALPGNGPFANRMICSPAASDFKWLIKPENQPLRWLPATLPKFATSPNKDVAANIRLVIYCPNETRRSHEPIERTRSRAKAAWCRTSLHVRLNRARRRERRLRC